MAVRCVVGRYRLKELEQQYALEKAATERQFEKQRQVCTHTHRQTDRQTDRQTGDCVQYI